MVQVPKSLRRRALEVEGWLDLNCPEHALAKMRPLLETPGARPAGLYLRTRALLALDRFREALRCIEEMRPFNQDPDWIDLTEAWCLKRTGDLTGAAECMRRMLLRSNRSAIGHYNLGCYLALMGEREKAIEELSVACGMEGNFRRAAETEADFDSLRGDPRFDSLLGTE